MLCEINPPNHLGRRRIDVENLNQPRLYCFEKNEWATVSLLSAFAWPESYDSGATDLFADCV